MSLDASSPSLEQLIYMMNTATASSFQLDRNCQLTEAKQPSHIHFDVMNVVLRALEQSSDVPQQTLERLTVSVYRYQRSVFSSIKKDKDVFLGLIEKIRMICLEKIRSLSQQEVLQSASAPPLLSMRKICAGHPPGEVNEVVHELVLDILAQEKRLFEALETLFYLQSEVEHRRTLSASRVHCAALPAIGPFTVIKIAVAQRLSLPCRHPSSSAFSPQLPPVSSSVCTKDEYKRLLSQHAVAILPPIPENLSSSLLLLQCRLSQFLMAGCDIDPDGQKFRTLVQRIIHAQQFASEGEKDFARLLLVQAKLIESHARFITEGTWGLEQLHRWKNLHEDFLCERPVALEQLFSEYDAWIQEFEPLAKVTKGLYETYLPDSVKENLTEKWDGARLKFLGGFQRALALYRDPALEAERRCIYSDSFQRLKHIYEGMSPSRRKVYHPKVVFSDVFSLPGRLVRRESPEEFAVYGKVVFKSVVDAVISIEEGGKRAKESVVIWPVKDVLAPRMMRKKRVEKPIFCPTAPLVDDDVQEEKKCAEDALQKIEELRISSPPGEEVVYETKLPSDLSPEIRLVAYPPPPVQEEEIEALSSSFSVLSLDRPLSASCQRVEEHYMPISAARAVRIEDASALHIGDGPMLRYQYDPRVLRWSSRCPAGSDPFTTDARYIGVPQHARSHIRRIHDVPYVAHKVLLLCGTRFGIHESGKNPTRVSYALIAEGAFEDGDFYRGVLTLARFHKKIFHVSMELKSPSTIFSELVQRGGFRIPDEVELDEQHMAAGASGRASLLDDGSRIQSISDTCITIADPTRKATWELYPL